MTTIETVKGCDHGDLEIQLVLDAEPGCSILVMRVALWEDGPSSRPGDIFFADDFANLDLAGMRALRDRLDVMIGQVEVVDAAFAERDR